MFISWKFPVEILEKFKRIRVNERSSIIDDSEGRVALPSYNKIIFRSVVKKN